MTSAPSDPEFVSAKRASSERSQKGKAVAASRRKETEAWANSLPEPQIPKYPPGTLRHLAMNHYNDLWASRGKFEKHAGSDASPGFRNRICVNFLRHEMSDYENQLAEAAGRVGARVARGIIRKKVMRAIFRAYPSLRDNLTAHCEPRDLNNRPERPQD